MTSLPETDTSKRLYGIDLLRLLSMFMVVLLHVLGRGGVLSAPATKASLLKYELVWMLEIAAYGAVNLYAMISGYIGVKTAHKWKNLILLSLQATFYLVGFGLIFSVVIPGSVTTDDLLKGLLPFGFKQYWYLTAYFGLFFCIPFLNKLLQALDEKGLKILLGTILTLFTLVPLLFRADLFYTGGGYTALWLILMYLVGGALRLLGSAERNSNRRLFRVWFFGIWLTWVYHFVVGQLIPLFSWDPARQNDLISYTSPTIVIASAALLLLFAKMELHGIRQTLVRFFAPLTFGVYLAHVQSQVWTHVMLSRFRFLADWPALLTVVGALACAFGVWLVCSLIDWLRLQIFRLIRAERFAVWLADRYVLASNRILGRLAPLSSDKPTEGETLPEEPKGD